eukprot:TRINITY_DN8875_c0_g1_i1.p1 TRINITY_DN8875_c0_g1~~TRINITY_DN8875_c0_g1_i1.p1  ORF type:complete len:374 (+),score=49.25 TRINITY_DN8875_c0_g1_i1:97-1218(+)
MERKKVTIRDNDMKRRVHSPEFKRTSMRRSLRGSISRKSPNHDESPGVSSAAESADDGSIIDKTDTQTALEFFSEQLRKVEASIVEQHQSMLSKFKQKRPETKSSMEERVDKLLEENSILKTELKTLQNNPRENCFAKGQSFLGNNFVIEPPVVPPSWAQTPPERPPDPGEVEPPRGPCPKPLVVGNDLPPTDEGKRASRISQHNQSEKDEELSCKFTLLEVWQQQSTIRRRGQSTFAASVPNWNFDIPCVEDEETQSSASATSEVDGLVALTTNSCFRHVMIHPNNSYKGAWDIGSLVMVLYDMITIPLGVFDAEPGLIEMAMSWVTRCFWTTDMPMAFFAGFITAKGAVEMRPRVIAFRQSELHGCQRRRN